MKHTHPSMFFLEVKHCNFSLKDIICLGSLTVNTYKFIVLRKVKTTYLIPIKICAPLNFAPLIFLPLIFAHPMIMRPFNFRALLFYCNLAVLSFIRGIFSSPFNFRALVLHELTPFHFCAS